MVGCNEDKCPVGGWIHQDCDDRLKGLSREQINDFDFTCKECLSIIESSNAKNLDENVVLDNKINQTLEDNLPNQKDEDMNEPKYEIIHEDNDTLYFRINGNELTPHAKQEAISHLKQEVMVMTTEEKFTFKKQEANNK